MWWILQHVLNWQCLRYWPCTDAQEYMLCYPSQCCSDTHVFWWMDQCFYDRKCNTYSTCQHRLSDDHTDTSQWTWHFHKWTNSHGESHVISHENWDWEPLKYFMTINYIYTTIYTAHFCFQKLSSTDITMWMAIHKHPMEDISYEIVCSASTSHKWAWKNPYNIHKCGYQVHFSDNIWADIIRNIVVGLYLLHGKMNVKWYCKRVTAPGSVMTHVASDI